MIVGVWPPKDILRRVKRGGKRCYEGTKREASIFVRQRLGGVGMVVLLWFYRKVVEDVTLFPFRYGAKLPLASNNFLGASGAAGWAMLLGLALVTAPDAGLTQWWGHST